MSYQPYNYQPGYPNPQPGAPVQGQSNGYYPPQQPQPAYPGAPAPHPGAAPSPSFPSYSQPPQPGFPSYPSPGGHGHVSPAPAPGPSSTYQPPGYPAPMPAPPSSVSPPPSLALKGTFPEDRAQPLWSDPAAAPQPHSLSPPPPNPASYPPPANSASSYPPPPNPLAYSPPTPTSSSYPPPPNPSASYPSPNPSSYPPPNPSSYPPQSGAYPPPPNPAASYPSPSHSYGAPPPPAQSFGAPPPPSSMGSPYPAPSSMGSPYPPQSQLPAAFASDFAPPPQHHPQHQQQQQQQQSSLPPSFSSSGMFPSGPSQPSFAAPAPATTPSTAFSIPDYVQLAHPKYASLSVGVMPHSTALMNKSQLPMGLVIRPLANPPAGSEAPPAINFGPVGVVRCASCRAYINPFVTFIEGGARWRCNLCYKPNEVPQGYFCALDAQGRRTDLALRPELTHAVVDIIAPVEYTVRPPMPPVFIFVIDVSVSSQRNGMLNDLCAGVLACLDSLPGMADKRTLVGFVTFDSGIHYYSLRPGGDKPSMFVQHDLEDLFLPSPVDLLVNLDEARDQVESLLSSLPRMHSKTRDVESASGAALEAAMKLCGRIGGRVMLFASSLPSLGPGRLANRENVRLLGSDREHTMLTPATDYFQKVAAKMTRYQIAVDVYLFADQYIDVATLNDLSKFSGGAMNYYPGYESKTQGVKFQKELTRALTRTQGWEAVVRVRCSNGMVPSRIYGNFFLRGTDLMALPALDCDKAFTAVLRNDDSVLSVPYVTIQSALLYTTSEGERRIRVINQALPVTQSLSDMFAATNVNAMTNVIAKQAHEVVLTQGLAKARESVRQKCVSIIRTYRSALMHGRTAATDAALNTLPLMMTGLMKNVAFRDGTDVRVDVRASALAHLTTMGIVEMETFFRPRLLPVTELKDEVGMPADSQRVKGAVVLPQEIGLSSDQLRSEGVYLADNGFAFVLRVGRRVDPEWLRDVFGVETVEQIDLQNPTLRACADGDTSQAARLANILSYLRQVSPHYQQLQVVLEGSPDEMAFFYMLIEDRQSSAPSLAEFNAYIARAGPSPNHSY